MKKYLFCLIIISTISLAQEKTLFDSSIKSNGAFGAVLVKASKINDNTALFVGGRGGWVINKSITLGAGMYGLVSNVPAKVIEKNYFGNRDDRLHFMYGGLELEYEFFPLEIIHYSFYSLIGVGFVSYRDYDQPKDSNYYNHNRLRDPFLVIEPAFNLKLNVLKFMKLALGISYRITSGAEYQDIDDKDLSGINTNLTLKFGSF